MTCIINNNTIITNFLIKSIGDITLYINYKYPIVTKET